MFGLFSSSKEKTAKPEVSSKTKETTTALSKPIPPKLFDKIPEKLDAQTSSSSELLQGIFKLMIANDTSRKLEYHQAQNKKEELDEDEERRHQEIIDALTPGEKQKSEKRKKETEVKKAQKKTQQKETPKKKNEPEKVKAGETNKPSLVERVTEGAKSVGNVVRKTAETGTTAAKTAVRVGAGAAGLMGASAVIAKEEGLSKNKKGEVVAYWDPPNDPRKLVSIGYGHQITKEEYAQGYIDAGGERVTIVGDRGIGTKMTTEQAKKLFDKDVPKYEAIAKSSLGDSWNKLNDNQKTALISYAYNVGSISGLVKEGLKNAIDNNDMEGAARIIGEKGVKTAKGEYLKQLDDRRHREADLFREGPQPKQVPNSNVGTLDNMSKENAEIKKDLSQTPTVNQTTVNNNTTSTTDKIVESARKTFNDMSPYQRKKNEQ